KRRFSVCDQKATTNGFDQICGSIRLQMVESGYGIPSMPPSPPAAGQISTIENREIRCGSVGPRAVDDGPELAKLFAVGGAANQFHLLQKIFRLQSVALLHLPHAVIRPGTDVVGIGSKRFLVPDL